MKEAEYYSGFRLEEKFGELRAAFSFQSPKTCHTLKSTFFGLGPFRDAEVTAKENYFSEEALINLIERSKKDGKDISMSQIALDALQHAKQIRNVSVSLPNPSS